MTDQEIICAWMEPRPFGNVPNVALIKWWAIVWPSCDRGFTWQAKMLDLDALWQVEERLTDEQWHSYVEHLLECIPAKFPRCGQIVHATADQKIKALAAVLRPIVTSGKEEAA